MLPAVRLLSSRGLCYLAQTHLALNLSFYLCFDTATTLPHYDWWNPGPLGGTARLLCYQSYTKFQR